MNKFKNGNNRAYGTTEYPISFILFIFCLIFSPPIIPKINLIFLLALYSVYQLITKHRKKVSEIVKLSGIKVFLKLFYPFIMYLILIMGINIIVTGDVFYINRLSVLYRVILLIPAQFICITYLIARGTELKYSFNDYCQCFLYAGLIQALIAILAFLFPPLQSFLIDIMASNTGINVYFKETAYSYGYTFRYFGFSATLLDTFGYGMGLLASISLFLGFKSNSKFLLFVPILLIPSLLNSRTGLIIFLVGFIFALFSNLFKINLTKQLKSFIAVILSIVFLYSLFNFLKVQSPSTYLWMSRGLSNFFGFLVGDNTQSYEITNVLFSDSFWILPEGIHFFFGTGHTIFGMRAILGISSDVGYVNQIWLVGILGVILLYLPYISMFFNVIRSGKNITEKLMAIFLVISFFITMVKADLIGYNPGIFITFSLCFIMNYISQSKKNSTI